jgi:hypothetical protein
MAKIVRMKPISPGAGLGAIGAPGFGMGPVTPGAGALTQPGQMDALKLVMGQDDFNPDEPRVAEGKGAGEWTKGGGRGEASSSTFPVAKKVGKRDGRPDDPSGHAPVSKKDPEWPGVPGAETPEFKKWAAEKNAPPANLEGDTPEAKAKIKIIREISLTRASSLRSTKAQAGLIRPPLRKP